MVCRLIAINTYAGVGLLFGTTIQLYGFVAKLLANKKVLDWLEDCLEQALIFFSGGFKGFMVNVWSARVANVVLCI